MTEEFTDPYGRGKRTGLVRRIWMLIAAEGGLWSVGEVADALGLPRDGINRALHGMATNQGLLHRSRVGRYAKFGVTPACKIPNGLTLKELAEAKLT